MSEFQPFPILDFGGISTEKEPWISPKNTWQSLVNGHAYRGQLKKREGRNFVQKLGIPVTGEVVGISGLSIYTGTLVNLPWVEPFDPFGTYNGTDYTVHFTADWASGSMDLYVAEVLSVGVGTHTRVVRATIDDSAAGSIVRGGVGDGFYSITFPNATTTIPVVAYEYDPELPVMGFGTFVGEDGTEHHLAFNTKRCWLMNNSEGRYYQEESGLGDIWAGTDTDHFWLWQFGDIMTINNGVDVPYKYDPTLGTTLVAMATDYTGAGASIQAARMFVNYQNYGVYLGTKEAGQFYEGRARWTQVGNSEAFNDANDYLDAPSNDVIRSAEMVGPDLFVGMRDTAWWRLELRDDAFAPFAWDPIDSDQGAIAKHGSVRFRDRIMSRSRYGIEEINRIGQVNATPDLGDEAFTWSAPNAYLTQALRYDARRQAWWSYADGADDTPLHALVMQFNPDGSRSLSMYDMPIHSYGTFRPGGAPVWDDISDPMDDIYYSMDSPQNQGGFTQLVGGNLIGDIYTWDARAADRVTVPDETIAAADWRYQDAAVDFQAKSIRLNPFPNQKVWLGWVDIIVGPSAVGSLEVSAYADYDSAPYKTTTLSLARGSSTSEKLIKRFAFNRVATFHTLLIREKTVGDLVIDYVAPWFKSAGPIRELT